MAIHELQTYISRLFIDFLSQTFIEGLTGLVLATFILFAFLEMMNVQTAGGPTVCTLYWFDIIHFDRPSLFV